MAQLPWRKTPRGLAFRAANQRTYRDRHPDRVAVQMNGWKAKNPGYERDRGRRRYAADPARQQTANKRWKKAHPEMVRAEGVQAEARRRARKYKVETIELKLTPAAWAGILAGYDGRCAYCFAETSKPQQEHVVPLSRGGHHVRSNVVPACKSCNSSKGTKPLMHWLFPEGR